MCISSLLILLAAKATRSSKLINYFHTQHQGKLNPKNKKAIQVSSSYRLTVQPSKFSIVIGSKNCVPRQNHDSEGKKRKGKGQIP